MTVYICAFVLFTKKLEKWRDLDYDAIYLNIK